LASILAETAVRELTYGMNQVVVGWVCGHPAKIAMSQAVRQDAHPKVGIYDVRLVRILGR